MKCNFENQKFKGPRSKIKFHTLYYILEGELKMMFNIYKNIVKLVIFSP